MGTDQIPLSCDFEQYCQAMELISWPMILLDKSSCIRYGNSQFRELVAPAEAELLLDWLPDDQRDAFKSFVWKQCSALRFSGSNPAAEHHNCCVKSGKRLRPMRVESRLVSSGEEHFLALLFCELSTSHSASHQDEIALGHAGHLEEIINHLGSVVYIKDLEGHYHYANKLFEATFQLENELLRGKSDFDIFPEGIAERFRQSDKLVLKTGETLQIQEVATQEDGLHTYISTKFPLYESVDSANHQIASHQASNKIVGMAGISTDITDHLWAEQEIHAALTVQNLLYPRQAPVCAGFDIAGIVRPAEVTCGDYYDYIWLSPTRMVVAVGDVSGHGLGPALEMVETRAYLRAILRTEVRLDVVMECLNEFLCRDLRDSAFVTLFLAEIDVSRKTFRYVGAGHQADFIRSDKTAIPLKSTGLVLGIEPQIAYRCSEEVSFSPGDMLLLSTDGISESKNRRGELFGAAKMVKLVSEQAHLPAAEIAESLVQAACHFCPGPIQSDDMTAVVVKCVS